MLELGHFASRIIATRELPGRPAITAPLPPLLPDTLKQALQQRGIQHLYAHQAEMYARARAGENLVITTGTASGKTLAFLLPVLHGMIEDPAARAIFLYPTKALAHDQLRSLVKLAEEIGACARVGDLGAPPATPIGAGVYDGDTPPLERKRIRERAHLVLTNPDMLNSGLLPAHGRPGYAHLFRHVRWIVIDELHTYRGAFGAHFSNVMRRLIRLCAHYGSEPQVLASSATIANPTDLAERLCHRPFGLVDRDGSPSAGRTVHFWQPPLLDNDMRKGVVSELAALVPHLVRKRQKTIAFCRSRKETELVLKEARDRLSRTDRHHDESSLLAAYRGGYTPKERRKVEEDLIGGRLLGVVSTNALELGIDIGALEVVVQGGFPGTRASFWQQMGRAGRRGSRAHAIVVLAQTPEDQYIAADPDWLTGQPAEHAVVDPNNLTVQLAHVRAAAAELPLTLHDAGYWPDLAEILPSLVEANELRAVAGTWHWTGGPFPAGDFSLRNTDIDRFKVVNRKTGQTLTEMTRPQVYREAHTRAIYLHDGQPYVVETLDLVNHTATVLPVEQNYYTQPDVRTHIDALATQQRRPLGVTESHFGDIRVHDSVVGYKMMEFHNHQTLGYEALHQPLARQFETEALWWPIPAEVLAALGREHRDALRGVVHAVRALCRLRTMAESADLACTTFAFTHEQTGATSTAVVAYDNHKGGIGFAAKGFDLAEGILQGAVRLVRDCPCKGGCPACTGENNLDKSTVLWALQSFLEALPPPAHLLPSPPAASLAANEDILAERFCPFERAHERWTEVLAAIRGSRAEHSGFFERVLKATPRGARLALELESPELAAWAAQPTCQPALEALVARFVAVPPGFRLLFEVTSEHAESAARRRLQVRRRLEDFRRAEPHSETEANERLAGGFVLPTQQAPSASAPPPRLYAPKPAPPGSRQPEPEPDT